MGKGREVSYMSKCTQMTDSHFLKPLHTLTERYRQLEKVADCDRLAVVDRYRQLLAVIVFTNQSRQLENATACQRQTIQREHDMLALGTWAGLNMQ